MVIGQTNQTHRPHHTHLLLPAQPHIIHSVLTQSSRPYHPTNKARGSHGRAVQQPAWSNSSLLASYSGFSQRLRVQVPSSVSFFSFLLPFLYFLLLLFTPLLLFSWPSCFSFLFREQKSPST
ncbi:hypothetical protein CGRA01v4_09256 [Colletotrichum graminicola]|nr:hypothetical protein CGRA01v4_09256 [Colletotrichum graminicola]